LRAMEPVHNMAARLKVWCNMALKTQKVKGSQDIKSALAERPSIMYTSELIRSVTDSQYKRESTSGLCTRIK